MLKDEFKYYLANQKELVKNYSGKFLVIKDLEIKGKYDSQVEAYENAVESFELGTFLIQHCLPGSDSYTQTFHSRVIINEVTA